MNEILTINSHWAALIAAIILTAVSQVLLRSGAKGKTGSISSSFLNPRILFSYSIFLFVVLLTIYALQGISLKAASAANSITFILVPLMAYKFNKDPLNTRLVLGSIIIVIGIVVFFA